MYLGIDIGASYCKSALIDTKKRAIYYTRVPMPSLSSPAHSPDLIKETSMGAITDAVLASIKEIIGKAPGSIDAVGVAGQMHGILFVDGQNEPVSNFISWQDARTTELMPGETVSYLDYLKKKLSGYRHLTGTGLRSGMLGPMLFWWAQNGLIDDNYKKVSFLSDYFVSFFTDSEILCDHTQAAGSGVYNLKNKQWLKEFISTANLSESIMPEIVDSGTMAGKTSKSFGSISGISEGIPVYVSVGDYHASLFSSGFDRFSVSLNVGTGAQVSLMTETPVISPNFETRPFFGGYFTKTIPGLPGGRNLSLFNNFVNETIQLFTGRMPEKDVLTELDRLSLLQGEETTVICNPNFYGSCTNSKKSGFFRLKCQNLKITDFFQALLKGVVGEYRNALDIISDDECKKQLNSVLLSGGVVQKSRYMVKLIERHFGMDVRMSRFKEEAAVGAALLAAEYSGMDREFKKEVLEYSQV